MKLKFKSDLKYQNDAINSVVDIFKGRNPMTSNFTVLSGETSDDLQFDMPEITESIGIGNRCDLTEDDILDNVQKIQMRNNLPRSEKLKGMNFTVEMETGTGKTYVYLKSIYEMNKKYGFKKFIIVVPSVAIREGTYKTIDITKDHFANLYDNESVESFVYDSSKLEQVRNFATSNTVEIMIINIDAFRKGFENPEKEDKANIIHRSQDKLNGQKPIDLIAETNPIVIIDEPQSVDTTQKSKEAISSLNPLCTLRYSATHVDKYNMVYRLDAVDAYEQKLVKKIEVLSVKSEESFNKPYIRLVKTEERKASIEIDIQNKKGAISRKVKKVKQGDDLFDLSGGREIYRNHIVEDISWGKDDEYIIINGEKIWLETAIGDIDDDLIRRFQIRKTIEEHLEKEIELNKQGIKVLSLFFIDKVANYRNYLKDGSVEPGKYAIMFEEEYEKLIKEKRFSKNTNKGMSVGSVHNGYFAQDTKGKLKDTKGNTKADEDIYSLIMKDKERLLDKSNPLRFIFSHSALREGWDNPNVFQICTLRDSSGTYIKKRQEIGRGLRLCVNQDGERINNDNINVLTVMANESYAEFVENLQKELKEDTGINFGFIEKHSFANIRKHDVETDEDIYFGYDNSEKLYAYLLEKEYIDKKGNIQDKLKNDIDALKSDRDDIERFSLKNTGFEDFFRGIADELTHKCSVYEIKDASKKKKSHLNEKVLKSDDFIDLWDNINRKTVYSVDFDTDLFIKNCVNKISKMDKVKAPRIISRKDKVNITRDTGATSTLKNEKREENTVDVRLPNILAEIQNKTSLTRKTIIEILKKSKRLEDFKRNPQKFMEQIIKIINSELKLVMSKDIKYYRIDDCYSINEFNEDNQSILVYENDKTVKSKKSTYDYIVCDSGVEKRFAEKFEENPNVKVYTKLPSWFKIDTPIDSYNPDWAAVIEVDNEDKLYFIIETKGTDDINKLRPEEKIKIECAEKHFAAIGVDVKFKAPISNADSFLRSI